MNVLKKFPVTRYINDKVIKDFDYILSEYILSIYIDNNLIVKLICIPEYLDELILGYLYSESMISNAKEIKSIKVDVENGRADVELTASRENGKSLITTDSGDFSEIPYKFKNLKNDIKLKNITWEPKVVLKNANLLLSKSELFKKTGNVHSVMLCQDEKVLYFSEDIGRYNAFDKSIGQALSDNISLDKTCIYTSGRIPSSIAMKVIRVGIPMIVSRSAPTDTTLKVAKEHNLTVIGFAKGDKMNLYIE